jgi:hypothetical protein
LEIFEAAWGQQVALSNFYRIEKKEQELVTPKTNI